MKSVPGSRQLPSHFRHFGQTSGQCILEVGVGWGGQVGDSVEGQLG